MCKECNQQLSLERFAFDHRYGHMGRCRDCVNRATVQRRRQVIEDGTELRLVRVLRVWLDIRLM